MSTQSVTELASPATKGTPLHGISTAADPRSFQIRRSMYSYDFESSTDDRKFFGRNSTLDPDKPDLLLYPGTDHQGPILAACRFKHLSRDIQICVGDPTTDGGANVNWEKLVKSSLLKTQYTWETRSTEPHTESGSGRALMWKKTQSIPAEDSKGEQTGPRNFKLIDEETDEILALFTSARTWANCGTLEIRANHGEAFDLMVMIACIALFEKAHRNSITAGGSSFGAGSGGV